MNTVRTGRRPGDPEVTRQEILAAARDLFADVGFERATIRAIAAAAGVDPALIHHHFGTKQDLFAAAHDFPGSPETIIDRVASGPRGEIGERVVRFYLTAMSQAGAPPLSLLRAAATNEAAGRMLREFIEDVLLGNAKRFSDLPDARRRVALVGSHMIGVVFARTIVGLPEFADADIDDLVRVIAPTIQRYLTDPDAVG